MRLCEQEMKHHSNTDMAHSLLPPPAFTHLSSSHHEGTHERDDAEELHELLPAVEPREVVRIAVDDEPVRVETRSVTHGG